MLDAALAVRDAAVSSAMTEFTEDDTAALRTLLRRIAAAKS
ncbi:MULTISPECIES: hypothetical protein [unclassified Microbacterium]|nr:MULTISPECIES: hypothetical protein [unclassified Microbacterium]